MFNELQHQGIISDEDYFVVEDDLGWDIVETEIAFSSLWPEIARRFQLILADFPDWRVTMQVMKKYTDKRPGMGIVVYADGIEDELKREYLPVELRDISFQ